MKVSEGSQEGQSTARSVSRAHEDAVAVASSCRIGRGL